MSETETSKKVLGLLGTGHALPDINQGALPKMLAFFQPVFSLTQLQVGIVMLARARHQVCPYSPLGVISLDFKKVEYYNITVNGHDGEGAKLFSVFAGAGVNLLAFKAVPVEPMRTQFSLFSDDCLKMNNGAKQAGLNLDGPHFALVIKGYDDESGALADISDKLSHADINYGVVIYLEQEDCEKAIEALKS